MKSFIYSTSVKKGRFYKNATLKIYRIKNNFPVFLCEHKYNTGSCFGEENEAIRAIVDNGLLSKKALKGDYIDHEYKRDNYYLNAVD